MYISRPIQPRRLQRGGSAEPQMYKTHNLCERTRKL
jgi:hypothetical protein